MAQRQRRWELVRFWVWAVLRPDSGGGHTAPAARRQPNEDLVLRHPLGATAVAILLGAAPLRAESCDLFVAALAVVGADSGNAILVDRTVIGFPALPSMPIRASAGATLPSRECLRRGSIP